MQKSDAIDDGSENQLLSKSNDWNKCAICQQKKDEPLQCPAESKRQSDFGAGYKTLADNIMRMVELNCLPSNVNPSSLDEGTGIESTFIQNKARWHKSCSLQFNSTKLKRAEKRALKQDQPVGGKYTRSSATTTIDRPDKVCFICDEIGTRSNSLHEVQTLPLDARVRECAYALQDESLLAKLSEGDLVALEACYHSPCLLSLYRKANSARRTDEEYIEIQRPDGIVLAELIAFIEDQRDNSEKEFPVFRLADLATKYSMRMKQMGADTEQRVNTSRLKERILCQMPELNAFKKGRDIYLAFRGDVADTLERVHSSCDEDAIHLAKAASILRKDMCAKKYSFEGSFDQGCQEKAVPESLLSLVNMILYGPNIESQTSNHGNSQASLSISNLVQFNSSLGSRRRASNATRERRSKDRETPVPLYVGLSIHAKTRSRELIETVHRLGLSVSYDRVLSISSELGNAVCSLYHREQVVCPPNLRTGLFTTSAFDNIDHNPSSTTARDSFHGTGISMFQHASAEVGVVI